MGKWAINDKDVWKGKEKIAFGNIVLIYTNMQFFFQSFFSPLSSQVNSRPLSHAKQSSGLYPLAPPGTPWHPLAPGFRLSRVTRKTPFVGWRDFSLPGIDNPGASALYVGGR